MDPAALGRYLRESRETRELTLEEAVTALRIRRAVLESFEQGDFTVSDSPVQVRGMLRNYARFLGLDEERVLQYYDAAQVSPRRRKRRFGKEVVDDEPHAPRSLTDTHPTLPLTEAEKVRASRGWVGALLRNLALLLVSAAAIAIIIFVIVDTVQQDDGTAESIAEAATTPADGSPTATYTASFTPMPTQQATTDFSAQSFGTVRVTLEMWQRSWARVLVDGDEQFVGIWEPGEGGEYEATEAVEVTVANGAALHLFHNGEEHDSFGERGEEVRLRITTDGIETLSTTQATLTPSPTVLPPSATPQAIDTTTPADSASLGSEPTPTSIFDESAAESPTPQSPDALLASATPLPESTENASAAAPSLTPTVPPSEAASATPTRTPTPAAVLPLRETPSNPTPTKEG